MAPLAGIALLSAAAAVALNPVLVSVSLTNGKKRKKRDTLLHQDQYLTPQMKEKIDEIEVKEELSFRLELLTRHGVNTKMNKTNYYQKISL